MDNKKSKTKLQEEKEQHNRMLKNRIAEVLHNTNQFDLKKANIQDMGMTTRTTNCLIRAGIYTVEDLLILLEDDLENLGRIRNLGEKSFDEIIIHLKQYNN